MVSFIIFVILHYLKSSFSQTENIPESYLSEMYASVQMNKLKRMHLSLFLIRRTMLVFSIIILTELVDLTAVLIINTLIHLFGFLHVTILRPMKSKTDNFVEIMNEAQVSVISSVFIFIQDKDGWNDTLVFIIIGSLLVNNLIIMCISSWL